MASVVISTGAALAAPPALPSWVTDESQEQRDQLQLAAEVDELRDENEQLRMQLARAHQLLRTIKRIEPKTAKAEGADDDPGAGLVVGYATALAAIRIRIDLYQAGSPEAR